MARATTSTAVANLALGVLKVDAVSSISTPDKGSKPASTMAKWYEDTVREVLAETIWDCAVKRTTLPASASVPSFGYSAAFTLPADFIRVATIGDEDDPITDYEIEDGLLLVNEAAPLKFRYVYDQQTVSKWSPKLLMSVVKKLAANTCYEITGSREGADKLADAYVDYLADAKGIDAQDNPPRRIQRSKYRAARLGYSTTRGTDT